MGNEKENRKENRKENGKESILPMVILLITIGVGLLLLVGFIFGGE